MAGGRSFHNEGPTTVKAQCWAKAVLVRGTKRSRRSADRTELEEIAESGFRIRSLRYSGFDLIQHEKPRTGL